MPSASRHIRIGVRTALSSQYEEGFPLGCDTRGPSGANPSKRWLGGGPYKISRMRGMWESNGLSLSAVAKVQWLICNCIQLPCLSESLGKTKCELTDTACICGDQQLQDAVAVCVLQKCTKTEALCKSAREDMTVWLGK